LLRISTNTLLQTLPRLLPLLSIEISGSWRGKCTDIGARCYCVHSVDGRVVQSITSRTEVSDAWK
jgi:hypothetical protein